MAKKTSKGKKSKYSSAERRAYNVGYGQGLALQGFQYDVYLSFLRKSDKERNSFNKGVEAGTKDRKSRDENHAKIRRG